jgi:hypothetical protein
VSGAQCLRARAQRPAAGRAHSVNAAASTLSPQAASRASTASSSAWRVACRAVARSARHSPLRRRCMGGEQQRERAHVARAVRAVAAARHDLVAAHDDAPARACVSTHPGGPPANPTTTQQRAAGKHSCDVQRGFAAVAPTEQYQGAFRSKRSCGPAASSAAHPMGTSPSARASSACAPSATEIVTPANVLVTCYQPLIVARYVPANAVSQRTVGTCSNASAMKRRSRSVQGCSRPMACW